MKCFIQLFIQAFTQRFNQRFNQLFSKFIMLAALLASTTLATNSFSDQKVPEFISAAGFENLLSEVSNWDRWGDLDQPGTATLLQLLRACPLRP